MTVTACQEHRSVRGSLFCPKCGKLVEPGSLQTVDVRSFSGAQSLSPKIEAFMASGDPEKLV